MPRPKSVYTQPRDPKTQRYLPPTSLQEGIANLVRLRLFQVSKNASTPPNHYEGHLFREIPFGELGYLSHSHDPTKASEASQLRKDLVDATIDLLRDAGELDEAKFERGAARAENRKSVKTSPPTSDSRAVLTELKQLREDLNRVMGLQSQLLAGIVEYQRVCTERLEKIATTINIHNTPTFHNDVQLSNTQTVQVFELDRLKDLAGREKRLNKEKGLASRKPYRAEEVELIRGLMNVGVQLKEIADLLGRDYTSVRKCIKREAINRASDPSDN